MASFIVVAALAVIFTFPGWNSPIKKLNVRAASTVTVTNGQINSSFQGSFIPASSPTIDILKITLTTTQTAPLNSVQVNFSGTGFAADDLATLTTDANSGVAFYTDGLGGTAGQFDPGGVDTLLSTGTAPSWTGTNVTLIPSQPPLPTGTYIYYVVIKTSGTILNNDEIRATLPTSGVVTGDGNGPASDFVMNFLRADTAAPQIASVSGYAGASTITVRFNKPVQKVGGGNLAYVGAGDPFTYADGGGTAQTITAIAHNAGQDFATL